MRITNPRDLGLFVRDRRRLLGQTQTTLAKAANVSRRWLSNLEAGKPSAEIALVFRTLDALGVILDARLDEESPGEVDLDEYLTGFTPHNAPRVLRRTLTGPVSDEGGDS